MDARLYTVAHRTAMPSTQEGLARATPPNDNRHVPHDFNLHATALLDERLHNCSQPFCNRITQAQASPERRLHVPLPAFSCTSTSTLPAALNKYSRRHRRGQYIGSFAVYPKHMRSTQSRCRYVTGSATTLPWHRHTLAQLHPTSNVPKSHHNQPC